MRRHRDGFAYVFRNKPPPPSKIKSFESASSAMTRSVNRGSHAGLSSVGSETCDDRRLCLT